MYVFCKKRYLFLAEFTAQIGSHVTPRGSPPPRLTYWHSPPLLPTDVSGGILAPPALSVRSGEGASRSHATANADLIGRLSPGKAAAGGVTLFYHLQKWSSSCSAAPITSTVQGIASWKFLYWNDPCMCRHHTGITPANWRCPKIDKWLNSESNTITPPNIENNDSSAQ